MNKLTACGFTSETYLFSNGFYSLSSQWVLGSIFLSVELVRRFGVAQATQAESESSPMLALTGPYVAFPRYRSFLFNDKWDCHSPGPSLHSCKRLLTQGFSTEFGSRVIRRTRDSA